MNEDSFVSFMEAYDNRNTSLFKGISRNQECITRNMEAKISALECTLNSKWYNNITTLHVVLVVLAITIVVFIITTYVNRKREEERLMCRT